MVAGDLRVGDLVALIDGGRGRFSFCVRISGLCVVFGLSHNPDFELLE